MDFLGTIIEKYINKNLHIDSISLKWDTIHDQLRKKKLLTKIKYYIVMGLHQFTTTPISKIFENNINYKNYNPIEPWW